MTSALVGDAVVLGATLLFVRQLDRSIAFYEKVFELRVHARHGDLALLESAAGTPVLALRSIGAHAAHGLEQVGISRLVWFTAPAHAVLLRERLSRTGVRELFLDVSAGGTVVFADPDGIAHVVVAAQAPDWPGHDAIPPAAWLRGL